MMMNEENSIWSDSSNFLSWSSSSSTTMNEHRSQSSSYYDPFGYNFWTPARLDKDLLFPIDKKLSSSPIPTLKQPQTFRYYYHDNNTNNNVINNHTTSSNNINQKNQMSRQDFNSMMDFNGTDDCRFNQSPVRLNNGRTTASSTTPGYLCVFCKSNSEPEEIYRSHPLKLNNNIVVCPSLRNYTCCICKATGDNAHTIKYCPYNKRGYFATRSHEKCNTNNNSKYRMKIHLVDGILDSQKHGVGGNKSSSTFSVGQQQEKNTFHQRHFRPIQATTSSESDEDDEDTFNHEPHPKRTTKGTSGFQNSRSNNGNTLKHQLVFFNRTIQKGRS